MSSHRSADVAALQLRITATGVTLPVHAQPGARRNGVVDVHNGRLKVAVTQAPEQGKANKALIKVLASALDISRSAITLERGAAAPLKDFHIEGLTADELRNRLAQLLSDQ